MSNQKLHIQVPPAYLVKLRELATAVGLTPDDYVSGLVLQHVLSGGSAVNQKRLVGRPITVQPDDIPSNIERAANNAGFAGVTKRGRLWTARLGSQTLGNFSSPEMAAVIRHYTFEGFRVGRVRYMMDDLELPEEMARNATDDTKRYRPIRLSTAPLLMDADPFPGAFPALFEQPPASPPGRARISSHSPPALGAVGGATVDAGGEEDDPSAEEEATAEESRAASAGDGGRRAEPAASASILPWEGLFGQEAHGGSVRRPVGRPRRKCPVCAGELTNVHRKRMELCLLCNSDYEAWEKLPAAGEVPLAPTDGVYVSNPDGSSGSEPFTAYVKRVRGL